MDRICFERPTFNMYLFILLCVGGYLIYYIVHSFAYVGPNVSMEKIMDLKDQLFSVQLNEQKCQQELSYLKQNMSTNVNSNANANLRQDADQSKFLNKIYDPLSGTSPINPQGSFSNPRGFDAYRQFQQLGYISNGNGTRYPIMGRYRDAGRSDRFEYYFIDNERGRIKVPLKTKNYKELYDGDNINIDELGSEFTFKKYEDTDGNRYDPNIIY